MGKREEVRRRAFAEILFTAERMAEIRGPAGRHDPADRARAPLHAMAVRSEK